MPLSLKGSSGEASWLATCWGWASGSSACSVSRCGAHPPAVTQGWQVEGKLPLAEQSWKGKPQRCEPHIYHGPSLPACLIGGCDSIATLLNLLLPISFSLSSGPDLPPRYLHPNHHHHLRVVSIYMCHVKGTLSKVVHARYSQ